MTDPVFLTLVLLLLLQTKHLFADFYLQTPLMLSARGVYLHAGRVQHAGLHGLGSLVAITLVGVPFGLALAIAAADALLHFHIDWAKGRWSERVAHGPDAGSYWRAFGLDQWAHQVTYLLMVWVAIP